MNLTKKIFLLILFFITLYNLINCGMNTDVPVVLTPLIYPAATTPYINTITFATDTNSNIIQFEIQYYVNNTEANFLGYNLYLNTYPLTLSNILANLTKDYLYLDTGIQPSFSEKSVNSDNLNTILVTRRIKNFRAAPSPQPFYKCLVYYFSLTAYLRGGYESFASDSKSICASTTPTSCDKGTPCNPLK